MSPEEIAAAEAQVAPLSPTELSNIRLLLEAFTIRHQSHHRPIALVTSGGTATDLEVNSVRFLDNFSTGLRGAVSAEQFLRRGYAVIHLWREGSAAPYSRALSAALGTKQANHGLGFDALGRLFSCPGEEDLDEEEEMVSKVRFEDPWLTEVSKKERAEAGGSPSRDSKDGTMNLNRRIVNSSQLEQILRERAQVVKDGLLLTVKFRTVDDYLSKLKLCSEALQDSQSLAVIYLAAAVSDFYIPKAKRSLHKIQSQNYDTGSATTSAKMTSVDDDNCLTLKLHPVPKLIPALRRVWAPDAFTISFKLETDTTILRHKAMLAMKNYGPHLVIGNILKTRHQKVWVLQQRSATGPTGEEDDNGGGGANREGEDYAGGIESGFDMKEISRSGREASSIDELEDAMIGHVVEKHFEYIANHNPAGEGGSGRTALMAGAEAAWYHNQQLMEKKVRIQNELYWKRVREVSLTLAGHALGMVITYGITTVLQRRFLRSPSR